MHDPEVLFKVLINIHTYECMLNQQEIHTGRSLFWRYLCPLCQLETHHIC